MVKLSPNIGSSLKSLASALSKKPSRYLLPVVIALALILRLWSASTRDYISFFEGALLEEVSSILRGEVPFRDFVPTMPVPIYLYLLTFIQSVLGEGVLYVRLLPVVSGVITSLVVYFIGKELYDESVGLLAAFLYAVSFNAVKWTGIIGGDELTILFASLAVYTFLLARSKGKIIYWVLPGAFAALASLIRPITLLVPMFLLLLLYEAYTTKRARDGLLSIVLFSCGAAVTSVAIIGYFALMSPGFTGALGQHLAQLFALGVRGEYLLMGGFINEELLFFAGALFFFSAFIYNLYHRERNFGSIVFASWFVFIIIQLLTTATASLEPLYLVQLVPVTVLMTAKVVDDFRTYAFQITFKRWRGFTINLGTTFLSLVLIALLFAYSTGGTFRLLGARSRLYLPTSYEDDFNDGAIDPSVWALGYIVGYSGGSAAETGGRLSMSEIGAISTSEYGVWTRMAFYGDLVASVDFYDANATLGDYAYFVLRIGEDLDGRIDTDNCMVISMEYGEVAGPKELTNVTSGEGTNETAVNVTGLEWGWNVSLFDEYENLTGSEVAREWELINVTSGKGTGETSVNVTGLKWGWNVSLFDEYENLLANRTVGVNVTEVEFNVEQKTQSGTTYFNGYLEIVDDEGIFLLRYPEVNTTEIWGGDVFEVFKREVGEVEIDVEIETQNGTTYLNGSLAIFDADGVSLFRYPEANTTEIWGGDVFEVLARGTVMSQRIYARRFDGGEIKEEAVHYTNATSGKFRISRHGLEIVTYFYENGEWIDLLGAYEDLGYVRLSISAYTTVVYPDVSIKWDNFELRVYY